MLYFSFYRENQFVFAFSFIELIAKIKKAKETKGLDDSEEEEDAGGGGSEEEN